MTFKKVLLAAATAISTLGMGTLPAMAEGPVLVKQVPPEYPRGAERAAWKVRRRISRSDGKVTNVEVVGASMPGVFDSAAVKALEQWKFEAGQPGPGEITIVFKLG